ncbi:HAD family hydrolase [Antribacter gilvus]|uniref:HAD family hydrolase n=1 Tax=Antribacter gilvus TaxID=2304675 RepID=UPI001F0BFF1C|nr:HAD family phosphatase [Antribacter gilvus]
MTDLPAAVLFDMDGTLVDSEPYWMQAEHELVAQHGGAWTHEDALGVVGQTLLVTGARLQAAGVPMEPAEIVAWLVDRVNARLRVEVPWRPGVLTLLGDLRAAGVPCAVVTMSYRSQAEAVAAGAPADTFSYLVTGDEVTHGKPHPEPYLTAASLLGVPVEECVAIEDSPVGISSAVASGARTLGVEAVVPVEERPGLSRARSLEQVDLGVLARIASGEVVDLLA